MSGASRQSISSSYRFKHGPRTHGGTIGGTILRRTARAIDRGTRSQSCERPGGSGKKTESWDDGGRDLKDGKAGDGVVRSSADASSAPATAITAAAAALPAATKQIVNAALISQIQAQLRASNPATLLHRKAARQLYVGNIPIGTPNITEPLTEFLNQAMLAAGLAMSHEPGTAPLAGSAVLSVWLSAQQTFGFAEFRSEEVSRCCSCVSGSRRRILGQMVATWSVVYPPESIGPPEIWRSGVTGNHSRVEPQQHHVQRPKSTYCASGRLRAGHGRPVIESSECATRSLRKCEV